MGDFHKYTERQKRIYLALLQLQNTGFDERQRKILIEMAKLIDKYDKKVV